MLFLQIAGAKVLNYYELQIINYKLFITFAAFLTILYEISWNLPDCCRGTDAVGALFLPFHVCEPTALYRLLYYNNRCSAARLVAEEGECLLTTDDAGRYIPFSSRPRHRYLRVS